MSANGIDKTQSEHKESRSHSIADMKAEAYFDFFGPTNRKSSMLRLYGIRVDLANYFVNFLISVFILRISLLPTILILQPSSA
jgi:hypothetical protein